MTYGIPTPASGPCPYCGGYHQLVCPTIKAIEYYENGTIKTVTFRTAQDYVVSSQLDTFNPNRVY